MIEITTISDLPNGPAVYALYGGRGRGLHVAYVGSARDVRARVTQHLIRRDSSITTGVSVVMLNADLVTQACWWAHPSFANEARLHAAELVAFDALDPALRSRGQPHTEASAIAVDPAFRGAMERLFAGEPTGRLTLPSLQDALERIANLEERLHALETTLRARQ